MHHTCATNANTDGDKLDDKAEIDAGYNPNYNSDVTQTDNAGPELVGTCPAYGSDGVPVNVEVQLTFNEAVDSSALNTTWTGTGDFYIVYGDAVPATSCVPLGTPVPFTVDTSTNNPTEIGVPYKIILVPESNLAYNTEYEVYVNLQKYREEHGYVLEELTCIKDPQGNIMPRWNMVSFTTATTDLASFQSHEPLVYQVPDCERTDDGGLQHDTVCWPCKARYCTIPYTGECYWWEEDEGSSGPGGPIGMVRAHRNKLNEMRSFGYNWIFNYDQEMTVTGSSPNQKLSWTAECGLTFELDQTSSDGSRDFFESPPGLTGDTFWKDGSGNMYRREQDGTVWKFDSSSGKLISRTDRNNNQTTFSGWGTSAVTITGPDNSVVCTVTYGTSINGVDVITKVEESMDGTDTGTWEYRYYTDGGDPGGSAGDLKEVEAPDGRITKYTYWKGFEDNDLNHNLKTVTAPNDYSSGNPFLFNAYDDEDRVIQQEYGYGVIMNSYAHETTDSGSTDIYITWQTDRNGHIREFRHVAKTNAENCQGTENTHSLLEVHTIVYESPSQWETVDYYTTTGSNFKPLMKTVYPKGNWVRYERNSVGNITEVWRGAASVAERKFDSWTYESDFGGVKMHTQYENGSAVSVTLYTYDYESATPENYFKTPNGTGGWTSESVPSGYGTWSEYLSATSNDGAHRDHGGNLISTSYFGSTIDTHPTTPSKSSPHSYQPASGGVPQVICEAFYSNASGQQTGRISAKGVESAWQYYGSGDSDIEYGKEKYSYTGYSDSSTRACIESQYSLTSYNGRTVVQIAVIDARSHSSTTLIDCFGMVLKTVDAAGYETYSFYDDNNNLNSTWVELVYPTGYSESVPTDYIVSLSSYDILNDTVNNYSQIDGSYSSPTFLNPDTVNESHFIITTQKYDLKQQPVMALMLNTFPTETRYNSRDLAYTTIAAEHISDLKEQNITYFDNNGNAIKFVDDDSDSSSTSSSYSYTMFDFRDLAIISVTEPDDEDEELITVTSYNDRGIVTKVKVGVGTISTGLGDSSYIASTSIVSFTTIYSESTNIIDEIGRIVRTEVAHFDNEGIPVDDGIVKTTTIYNEDSQAEIVVYDNDNPGGGKLSRSQTKYDKAGRAWKTIDSFESYDVDSELVGNYTESSFDKAENVIMTKEHECVPGLDGGKDFYSHSFYNELNQLTETVDNVGNTRYYSHDSMGNLLIYQDANGEYGGLASSLDDDSEHTFPGGCPNINEPGHKMEYGIDLLGRSVWIKQYLEDSTYIETQTEWNDNGTLHARIDGEGNRTEFEYNGRLWLTKRIYADGSFETIEYFRNNLVWRTTDANGTIVTGTYDAREQLVSREIDLGPGVTSLNPDMEYQTTFEHFKRDPVGRLTQADDNDTRVEREHDSLGNILSEKLTIGDKRDDWEDAFTNAAVKITTSLFDNMSNKNYIAYPHDVGQGIDHYVTITYDILSRPEFIKFDGSNVVEYTYIGPGLRVYRKYIYNAGGSTPVTYQQNIFDDARQAIRVHNHKIEGDDADPPKKDPSYPSPDDDTSFDCFCYSYDREGNKWYERRYPDPQSPSLPSNGKTQGYIHDYIYRLTDARYRIGDSDIELDANNTIVNPVTWGTTGFDHEITYALDDASNRTETEWIDSSTSSTTYQPNKLNQYEAIGSAAQEHDVNGNLIDDGSKQMWFDYANRLVQLDVYTINPDNPHKSYFRSDALGRRVAAYYANLMEWMNTYMFYDRQQVLSHYYGSGGGTMLLRHFVYGIGIDEPLMLYRTDTIDADEDENTTEWLRFYYHFNQLGSVVSITDYEGDVVERYEFDVYGEPTIWDKDGDEVANKISPLRNVYMFTSREWDGNQVVCGLYHYRARAYNPETGRFLQRDRIWRKGAGSLYSYCDNIPTGFVDPTGLLLSKVAANGYGAGDAHWQEQRQFTDAKPNSWIGQKVEFYWRLSFYSKNTKRIEVLHVIRWHAEIFRTDALGKSKVVDTREGYVDHIVTFINKKARRQYTPVEHLCSLSCKAVFVAGQASGLRWMNVAGPRVKPGELDRDDYKLKGGEWKIQRGHSRSTVAKGPYVTRKDPDYADIYVGAWDPENITVITYDWRSVPGPPAPPPHDPDWTARSLTNMGGGAPKVQLGNPSPSDAWELSD